MTDSRRKNWEDLNITRDEMKNIAEALKNDEFRKLLVEYVEETQDPANRRKYEADIIQLEAERGIDCTFVNPTPGFVVKTSVNGTKKTFINICSNDLINKPSSKPMTTENSRGLSWSIPYSIAPGRDDYDKKNHSCTVYDVVFHPDTLHLAQNNFQFKNLVIDTALKGLEDAYHIAFDRRNVKLPKLRYKGQPYSTVIRKKSQNSSKDVEETKEFFEKFIPPKMPTVDKPTNEFKTKSDDSPYTTPHFIIRYRNNVDLQEYTEAPDAKINSAIPNEIVIDIHLPLLNSSKSVQLDILEKALELKCDTPSKYKLALALPYEVMKDSGSAKFDTDRRILTITLPVNRKMTENLIREDSGVEADICDTINSDTSEEIELNGNDLEEKPKSDSFLSKDIHYIYPSFDYNRDGNSISFILNVKNVDPNSIKRRNLTGNGFQIKFTSIGSGFFPVHYAFCVKFNSTLTDDIAIETWDNNLIVQAQLSSLNDNDKIFVGVTDDEEDMEMRYVDSIIDLSKQLEESKLNDKNGDRENTVNIISANVDSVVFDVHRNDDEHDDRSSCFDVTEESSDEVSEAKPKMRTFSEGSGDESNGVYRKSILKNRMNRSLSESCADDRSSNFPSGVLCAWSDSCIPEENKDVDAKKTVRFSKHIQQQFFRVNSSIMGQRRKNQKRAKNKKRSQERRASESENSEDGDERSKWMKQKDSSDDSKPKSSTDCAAKASEKTGERKRKTRKPKNLEFQSNLIHSLDE